MEYLLFLQELRLGAGNFVNEFILNLSAFMGETGGQAVIALVYWCICKWAGSLMLLNFSSAYMTNQTLKNIFCVQRPFLLDERLQPYVSASGYSFPSGHTMLGTAVYASAAVWQRRRKWFVALCALMTLLTAFGRNWIGVHTIKDVLAGIAVSCAVVFLNLWLLKQLEKRPKLEAFFLPAGIVWAAALMVFIPGSFKVCGIYLGVLSGLAIERRWIGFQADGSFLRRALRFAGGMIAVLVFNKLLLPAVLSPLGSAASDFIKNFVTFLVITAGWPAVIKKMHI